MKELLIMAKSLGGGGSEVALIELIFISAMRCYQLSIKKQQV